MMTDQDNSRTTWTVTSDQAGTRLDVYLTRLPFNMSRSHWKRLIEKGFITIEGHATHPSYAVRTGDILEITIPPPEPSTMEPEAMHLDIIYEDDALLVLNKPVGMVVHPGAGHSRHTLANAVLHHCPDLTGIGGTRRPGIVHRLDKDTSGLLVVAKTEFAHHSLCAQIKERQVKRLYLALVHGIFDQNEGRIRTLIGRHPVHRQRMSIHVRVGREAITDWRVKERFAQFTLVEVRLHTGRTHQIRVHMSHLNHPVVGDRVYGRGRLPAECPQGLREAITALPGQALHAFSLCFRHPLTGETMEFSVPLPPSMQGILDILRSTG
ncbi:MAG: RluA family pseudouridine synthase [bacterium]